MSRLLDDDQIKVLTKKASRVIISGDSLGTTKQIGIKVGDFGMSVLITSQMDEETQKRKIRDMMMDLLMMNRRNDREVLKQAQALQKSPSLRDIIDGN